MRYRRHASRRRCISPMLALMLTLTLPFYAEMPPLCRHADYFAICR